MELTAKENIYLNGALLGYKKEFIDEHFDDIVSFAELEGFMDMPLKKLLFRHGGENCLCHCNRYRAGCVDR